MSQKKTFYMREFPVVKPNYSTKEIVFILEHVQLYKSETLLNGKHTKN